MLNFLKNVPAKESRIFGLDLLRAIAIFFVVVFHGCILLPPEVNEIINYILFDGVSIFFVLSGFLIGRILIKTMESKGATSKILFDFWIRRWFKTVPNYLLVLFILTIIHLIFDPAFNLSLLPRYLIFSQNLIFAHPFFFSEAWSLTIEEWFYVVIPILLFLSVGIGKLKPKNAVLIVAIIIILAVTFFRIYRSETFMITDIRDWDLIFRKQVVSRLDGIMYGVIAAYFSLYHSVSWKKYRMHAFAAAIAVFIFIKCMSLFDNSGFGLYSNVFTFSAIALGTSLLLPILSTYQKREGRFYSFVTYLSLISYSMYVVNFSLITIWIFEFVNWSGLFDPDSVWHIFLKYLLYWGLNFLLATLLYRFYEYPMMNLRDRFKKK